MELNDICTYEGSFLYLTDSRDGGWYLDMTLGWEEAYFCSCINGQSWELEHENPTFCLPHKFLL